MSYSEHVDRDVRLIILRTLHGEADYTLNSTLLQRRIETFGHVKSRDYVHAQLGWLRDEVGAITLTEAGSILVAKLTRRGADHVELRSVLPGIGRPGPGA